MKILNRLLCTFKFILVLPVIVFLMLANILLTVFAMLFEAMTGKQVDSIEDLVVAIHNGIVTLEKFKEKDEFRRS